jgi:hypothetical protein
MLRNTPEKVRSFFSDPHLAYIRQACAWDHLSSINLIFD